MVIEYCRSKTYNFGDDLNPWIWPKLFGDSFFGQQDGLYFVGIGTVLTSKRLNKQLAKAKEIIIFSSGAWDDYAPRLSTKCKVYGVRGPRTAERLGLPLDKVIGDGAYLLRKVKLAPVKQVHEIGFIPHHGSEKYVDWQSLCDSIGIQFISPKQPVDDFLVQLKSCKRVISEAMHGAIVADAMRIPWTPVKFSPLFCEEKWYDFAECMQLKLRFHSLPFYCQKKMPVSKALAIASKKIISKYLGIKPKWKKLIFTGFRQNSKGLDALKSSVRETIISNETFLSTDDVVDIVTNNQYQLLLRLKSDYS